MDKAVHPNVVRFHGCGRWPDPVEGHTYHVMDKVPGLPLDVWAETRNPSFLQFAEVGAKMALALGELHGRGVFHRDVKPENILIREPDGEPVLVDFGVGDYAGAVPLTTTPLPPGTSHLRSPEAMRFWMERGGGSCETYEMGAADDLYALGVSLYRAATGHYPFPPDILGDLVGVAICTRRAHAPRDFNRRVPRALSDVLSRMLAKAPEERYGSGAEVHAALMAAATFGGRSSWEASLFDWEDRPARKEGDAPGRRIRRPAFPTRPVTPIAPPVRLIPGVSFAGRMEHGQRARAHAPAPEGNPAPRPALPGRALAVALGARTRAPRPLADGRSLLQPASPLGADAVPTVSLHVPPARRRRSGADAGTPRSWVGRRRHYLWSQPPRLPPPRRHEPRKAPP